MTGDFKLSATLRGHEEDVSTSIMTFSLPLICSHVRELTYLSGPRSRLSQPTAYLLCVTR